MKAKEKLICRSAFPKSPLSLKPEPAIPFGIAHKMITGINVAHTLMSQSAIKAPGLDKINFQVLQMIWD